nr:O-antigen ligase family protein [Halomicroarcula limicola]
MGFHLSALTVLLLGIPFAFYLTDEGPKSRIWLLVPVVGAFIVRVTGSDTARGAFLIVLTLTGMSIFYAFRNEWIRWIRNGIASSMKVVTVALVSVTIIFLPSSQSGATTQPSNTEGTTGGNPSTSTDGALSGSSPTPSSHGGSVESFSVPFFDLSNLMIRIEQYDLGLRLFIDNPITGIGGANFVYYFTKLVDPNRQVALHNIYLAVIVETGVIGFLFYYGSIGMILLQGMRTIPTAESSFDSTILIALIAGVIGILAYGMLGHAPLTKVTVFIPFWIVLATISGKSNINRNADHSLS